MSRATRGFSNRAINLSRALVKRRKLRMTVKLCPGCGSSTTQEARFCRVCGAPTKAFDASDGQVSPQAQTIPLTEDIRSTDGLSKEERQKQKAATTSKISRVEVEKLLQRGHTAEQEDDGGAAAQAGHQSLAAEQTEASVADESYAAPTTSELQTPPVVASASQSTSTSPARRRSSLWLASLAGFACIALLSAFLAYHFLFSKRNRSAPDSQETTPAQSEAQQQQSPTQTASAENAGEPTVNPQPSPAPSPSLNTKAQANKAEAERASHIQAEGNRATEANLAVPTPPQPSPSASPPPKHAPEPTPANLSASDHYRRGVELWNSNRKAAVTEFRAAAQSNPDAYYYLGLSIAEGREPRSLMRAELVAALEYFQRAQSGPHRAEAARYVDRLGREFDRRKKQ